MKGRLIFVTALFSLAVILISGVLILSMKENSPSGKLFPPKGEELPQNGISAGSNFSTAKDASQKTEISAAKDASLKAENLSGNAGFEDERSEMIVALNEISRLNESGNYGLAEEKIRLLQEKMRGLQVRESGAGAIAVVCGVSILFFITAFGYIYFAILRPFEKMKGFAAEISAGNFDLPLQYERSNYFGEFTWAFDSMRKEIIKSRASEREAIENNKTVIATLSHDIKTPIASIRAYAEGLSASMDSSFEKRERYLSVITRKCDEVSRLTDDLFLHSVSDLDKLKITLEPVEICAFVENILMEEMAFMEETAFIEETAFMKETDSVGKGCSIEAPYSGKRIYPNKTRAGCGVIFTKPDFAAFVNVDRNRLVQVCENIINNAEKYAGTRIDVFFTREEEDIVLHFRDYGGGIPDENMPFVFDKFYRGSNCGSEQGSGLGLYIVKYIVEKMGGKVLLQNHKDGLEVKLILPVKMQAT